MRFTSLLLALLIGSAVYYWFALRAPQDVGPDAVTGERSASAAAASSESTTVEAVPVMVMETRAQATMSLLTLRGRTTANRNVNVPAETSGLVISQPLRKGATVDEGVVLCRLDPGARQAQLLEAEARLAEARAEFEAASTLNQKGFASETTRISRQAQLEAAQAAVDLVKLDISRLEIRAPFSGVLETDTAELGSLLAPGSTCARLIDLSTVKVTGFVSEQEVDQIALGQPAMARLINGQTIPGEISFISQISDPETRTFEVEVTLPNPDGRIRDGMTAELKIELPAQVASPIPQAALTLDDDGRLGVRLAEEGLARFYPVRIIREEVDGVWVAGLPEVAQVIVVGQEFVRDGRAIDAKPVSAGLMQ